MKTTLAAGGVALAAAVMLVGVPRVVAAGDKTGPDPAELRSVIDKGVSYLKKHQNEDGSFPARFAGPGVPALVIVGLLHNGYTTDEPVVARAIAYMEKSVKKNGGIYDKGLANYTTSVAVMAFQEANTGGKYDTLIKNAVQFLKTLQFDDDEGDVKYGGLGYNKGDRPDLSNTQFFLDALLQAGVPKDDPAVRRALKFMSRCQNLPGESNDQPFAKKAAPGDKGGFVYTPLDVDNEKSPFRTPDGGLRSTGGMTYAGLKSFLYAGVSKEDPRVQAALKYVRAHYTLEENPGMGQAGLYYYYHTFAKAMTALGDDTFTDADGKKHDWRKELFEALKKRQRDDGSWVNAKDRQYGESSPDLATAFAVLTLSYCRQK